MADARDRNTTSIAKAVEPRIQRDRKLLQELSATLDARMKATITKAELEQLSAAIQEEQKLLDAFVEGRTRPGTPDLAGPAALRAIRSKLIKRVPAAGKIATLHADHIAQTYGTLLHHSFGAFDPDIVHFPDVAIATFFDFQEFEAPYDFSDVATPKDPDLEFDGSYAVHQWGIFGNDIELRHSNSSITSGGTSKLAFTDASVGLNCTVPTSGRLVITLILRSLSSDIRFDMDERIGPTDGTVALENTIFVRVKGAQSGHLEATTIFDETRRFSGDDISGPLAVIPQGRQFIVTFTTAEAFAQNETVAITVASFLRAASFAFRITNRISALLNWHLEKVFVRVL